MVFKQLSAALVGMVVAAFNPAYGCNCSCCKTAAPAGAPAGKAAAAAPMANAMQMTLSVSGMTCAGCAAKVQKALMSVPGVQQATVDLKTSRAVVSIQADKCDEAALVKAVEQAGYGSKIVK
jgi:Cu+-exporting ATPase